MVEGSRISIWFFIGSLLIVYGIIIFVVSLPAFLSPAVQTHVVLARLHAGIWWGLLLVVLGVIYVVLFRPGKKKSSEEP